MTEVFKAEKVSEHVYWVGAIDWDIRNFHGYSTQRGTTYNAYLILADKITLVDCVKAPFYEEFLQRITSVIDPSKISYIISNHSELDHTGCLPRIAKLIKPEKIFTSTIGAKNLAAHFHNDLEYTPVQNGQSISLGNLQLTFYETRMLHWPDSMFTYLAEDTLLFSQDAFGMHLATGERFADQIDCNILEFEAAKYFANILLPYSALVTKLLEKVQKLNLNIKTIAPDHGPIWRNEIIKIVDYYLHWAAQKPTNKAVVVYDTMWQSTAKMARAIGEGLTAGGTHTKLMSLGGSERSEVATEILDAGALFVGSPTLNNHLYPTIADLLTYLKGLRPSNLIGAAFGSYGWSGEAVGQIEEGLKKMNIDIIGEGIKAQYVPDLKTLENCYSFGKLAAQNIQDFCNNFQDK